LHASPQLARSEIDTIKTVGIGEVKPKKIEI
jgi:hypothetical protein